MFLTVFGTARLCNVSYHSTLYGERVSFATNSEANGPQFAGCAVFLAQRSHKYLSRLKAGSMAWTQRTHLGLNM
jgi:hypothetical protein